MQRSVHLTCSNGIHTLFPLNTTTTLRWSPITAKTQTERSDRALDAWEEEHPFKSSDELTAFRELERLGVYTDADFYSPSKAKNGHYTDPTQTAPGRFPRASKTTKTFSTNWIDTQAPSFVMRTMRCKRLQLLRLYADEVGCPMNERTAAHPADQGSGRDRGRLHPRLRGERMDTTADALGVGGRDHVRHLQSVGGPAKGGKVRADGRDDQRMVSRRGVIPGSAPAWPLPQRFTSSALTSLRSDWHTLFKREGLIDREGNMAGPIEMLWHTGAPLHLTPEGIDHLGQIAELNPGSLFLLDIRITRLLRRLASTRNISFDGPARKLAEVLAPHKATLAMIHHTNKSVSGGNATNASRGSNALPAAASLTILMNWFKQPAEGQTQNDHRVVVKTQGRAKGTTLLIELTDDGWDPPWRW